MQNVPLDLKKNPDIKNLAADLEVGDRVCLYGSIKAKDDQTMTVTIDEVEEDRSEKEDEEEKEEGDGEEYEAGNTGSGTVGGMPDASLEDRTT